MKKWTAILCTMLMICLAAAAFAEAPVSNLYKPMASETFKALVGGKSFEARISGWGSYGEDEDAKYELTITFCERTRFAPEAIDNLAEHDILNFGDGSSIMVMEVTRDETGVTVKDGYNTGYSFFKAEDGAAYIVTTDTDNPLYTDVFMVTVPLEKDIRFLDGSDPEKLGEPVQRTFDDLLALIQDGTNFFPYNTKVTFDEDGKLVEFLYSYSPWN